MSLPISSSLSSEPLVLDFENTAIAFGSKSDAELRWSYYLFGLMNNSSLVKWGTRAALLALRLRLPITPLIEATIFRQFCGGTSLQSVRSTIQHLANSGVQTILDYGAEGKETEADFERTASATLEALSAAATLPSVPVVSAKVTGMMPFGLLERLNQKVALTHEEQELLEAGMGRLHRLCQAADTHGVSLYIDAEESWIQDALDDIVRSLMQRYNVQRAVVFNTFQMYRHDRLAYLKQSFEHAQANGYLLGAKLVRGAYMEKERARAAAMGYPSPIQPDKAASDRDFDAAVRFCVEHHERLASCLASHNAESNRLQATLMHERGIARRHPHLAFSQLYGMSDNLTFNLAHAGFNVSKYMPYGPVRDVVPYLIRRAQENSSVTGDMSRELQLLRRERERRSKA